MLFAVFLAGQGLRWQTIKSYVAAVQNFHIRAEVPFLEQDESLPRLQLMLQRICRVASQRPPTRPRLPITPSILRRVGATLKSQEATWDRQMIWAAMNLCFFGYLCSSETYCPSQSV